MSEAITMDGMIGRAWGHANGDPILLVHGVSGTSWDWSRSVMRMSIDGGYLVALDLPGFGRSRWLDDGLYSVERLSHLISRFADAAFGGRRFGYVGHSYGGKMGIQLAGQADAALTDLVLIDNGTDLGPGSPAVRERLSTAPPHFPDVPTALDACRGLYPAEPDDVYLLRMSEYLMPEGEGVAVRRDRRFIAQMVASDPAAESRLLRGWWMASSMRGRILRAEKSRMLTAETVDWMLDAQANSSADIVSGVGHNVLSEAPAAVAKELDELVLRMRGSS